MPTNILDSHSRLVNIKNRLGLNISGSSSVTSDYIKMKQIIKIIRGKLQHIEQEFREKYYDQKNFDSIFISNIPTYLETIPLTRLERTLGTIEEHGMEFYLVKKMKLKSIDNDTTSTIISTN